MATTRNSRNIDASPEALYGAFTNPAALEQWMAPGEMTGKVHNFDLRKGGGYEMSLYYPKSEQDANGKTSEREDRYAARFIELLPNSKIVEAIEFYADDPSLKGEMTMEILLAPIEGGTKVTIVFSNIPKGISPGDNEKGTELSLEKLARYVATEK